MTTQDLTLPQLSSPPTEFPPADPADPTSIASIAFIQARLAPLQAALAAHPLYASIRTEHHLRLFMQSHVFAVWDFMSLLKALQSRLTCTSLPWAPTPFPHSRRFLNEIVLGEESDLYPGSPAQPARPISHFELYLEAMRDFHADTALIESLIASLPATPSLHAFRTPPNTPAEASHFVESTFTVIRSASLPALAAAFTFGREDAIPTIFRSLVRELDQRTHSLAKFVWYLERHIEVDGEDHGPLSLRMVEDLCGNDPVLWEQAAQAAEQAITARLTLWDGILHRIQN